MKSTFILLIAATLFLPSCSIYKAANQPQAKDLNVLKVGTPRDRVIAELGNPIHTEMSGSTKVDIFSFKQGYSSSNKAGRVALHTVGNLFTAGLWEVIGTPAESIASGTEIKTEVQYDSQVNVKKVTPFKGAEKLGGVL